MDVMGFYFSSMHCEWYLPKMSMPDWEYFVELREIIKEHTFVGCVNKSFSLIQHQTKLYLVNNKNLT